MFKQHSAFFSWIIGIIVGTMILLGWVETRFVTATEYEVKHRTVDEKLDEACGDIKELKDGQTKILIEIERLR